jgi:Holliday junction resolvasome RuvABC endonuclease subunit
MAFAAIWDAGARFLTLVRRVDKLFTLQTKVEESLDLIEQRLRAVEDRLLRIEAEAPQLITEARGAASVAATAMSGAALNDVVTRLTRVEIKRA